MSFSKFCPKCGKETSALIQGLCSKCFLGGKELFSLKETNTSVCVKCGKLFFQGKWHPADFELLKNSVISKVKVSPDVDKAKVFVELKEIAPLEYETKIKVEGFLDDALVEQEKTFVVKVNKVSCDPCMKLNSLYREAVLQLRADNQKDADEMYIFATGLLEKEKAKDSLSGTSKIVKLKNGYDLWIGSKKAGGKVARHLSKLFKTKIKTSRTLIGETEAGKPKLRVTFCVKR